MKEEDYDLIDKLLAGKPSADDAARFEARMKDPEFENAYHEVKHISESLAVHERQKLRTLLTASDSADGKTKTIKISLAMAASVVLLITAGWFLWLRNSGEVLFNRYYAKYEQLEFNKPRGSADQYELKVRAYNNYKEGKIDSAHYKLDELVTQGLEADEEVIALRGLCYLDEGAYTNAIETFQKLDPQGVDRGFKEWYLALGFLGNGDKDAAEKLLIDIRQDPSSPFSSKASGILENW